MALPDSDPLPVDRPFPIFSLTKTLVAILALRLCSSGRIALDRVVGRWAPAAPFAGEVTIRHLLQHTSGLPNYGGVAEYHEAVRRGDQPWSDAEFIAKSGADRLLFPAGTGWSYSNIGYMVLRRAVEAVEGDELANLLRVEIGRKLRCASLKGLGTRQDLADLEFGTSELLGPPGRPGDPRALYHPGWVAPGVAAASAADVAAIFDALFAGKLVPGDLLGEMTTPRRIEVDPQGRPWRRYGYGLGLEIESDPESGPRWGHSGTGPGVTATVMHWPKDTPPLTVAVLSAHEDLAWTEWAAVKTREALRS